MIKDIAHLALNKDVRDAVAVLNRSDVGRPFHGRFLSASHLACDLFLLYLSIPAVLLSLVIVSVPIPCTISIWRRRPLFIHVDFGFL